MFKKGQNVVYINKKRSYDDAFDYSYDDILKKDKIYTVTYVFGNLEREYIVLKYYPKLNFLSSFFEISQKEQRKEKLKILNDI